MLLAGRVRKQEEEAIVLAILEKHFKRKVNTEELFSQRHVTSQFSECCSLAHDYHHGRLVDISALMR